MGDECGDKKNISAESLGKEAPSWVSVADGDTRRTTGTFAS